RGEHFTSKRLFRLQVGLSPLARGTQKMMLYFTIGFRFIPAGAGNTR
ncbi:hypothetical protein AD31_3337, partial [Escherichia coli 2-427-07_S4_C3]